MADHDIRYICRWNSTLSRKEWHRWGYPSIVVGDGFGSVPGANPTPTPAPEGLFAGHTPFTVMVGMAAPENAAFPPTYDDTHTQGATTYPSAHDIVTAARPSMDAYGTLTLAERRIFDNGPIEINSLRSMLAKCDGRGQFGFVSFKHANFADFYSGNADATLNIIRDEMIARRTAGPGGTPMPPHAISIYHEPAGDAGVVLSEWARMQVYCSNYFAGWGTDLSGNKTTYNAANDVRDMMAWDSIMNGNKWGPNRVDTVAINDAHPQLLIDTYRENGSILGADFYDGVPASDNLADYKATSDRTSMKLQAYIDWHRARNCGALFAGEFSATQADELRRVWLVAADNRDIFVALNHFSSGQNSKWEWRPIPVDYPQTNAWALSQYLPGNYVEIGGTTATEARLRELRRAIYESTQPEYTGPLGQAA